MPDAEFDVVTGAFGYIGRYIARRLIAAGRTILTLTGHPERPNPLGAPVRVAPFNFDEPAALAASLAGASMLYNTYWVRFVRGQTTFDRAVANTRALVAAAKQARVRRIVHISITNPAAESALPYFRGKAQVEELIAASGLSYAIVRPTVVFGDEDILVNNIAWLLRRFPVFAIPGPGDYRVQPVFVEDLAQLAVSAGQQSENLIVDAVGPEILRFDELVRLVARAAGSRALIVHVPPGVALVTARVIGQLVGDVLLTRDEIAGLMADLLVSHHPPTGTTRLSAWLAQHAGQVGQRYASELQRHF
jgi:NADH dehydrogenase